MAMSMMQEQLTGWAHWVRDHRLGGYTSPAYMMMRDKIGTTVGHNTMPDEDALRVDRAVARLLKRDPIMGKVLMLSYVSRLSYREVGKSVGKSHEYVRVLLRSGEAWVEGNLDFYNEAA